MPKSHFSGSAASAAAVTPSDGTTITQTLGLYVANGGNVTVDMVNVGTNIEFVGVPNGAILPIQVNKVYATGTTATGIVALW